MNKLINIWICCSLLMLLVSCSMKTTEQKYTEYINDPANKITQKISVGEVTASMKLMPDTYRDMISSRSEGRINGSDDGLCYFNAKFVKTIGEKPTKEKILYLDFDMQQDFALLSGTDSIPPVICQRIENGISGSYEYMLAFEKPVANGHTADDFSVIYHDKIFGIGTVAFVYDQAVIKKIPKLKSTTTE